MLETEINVLRALNECANVSQRKLSEQVGVSLGKINSIIRSLSDEGYIKKIMLKNSIEYRVTDKGMEKLNYDVKKTKLIRLRINKNEKVNIKEAVILAAGRRKDFNLPVALLDVGGVRVIDRMINILKKSGIAKIIIIAGYKHEVFNEILEKYKNVKIIINNEYSETGTMSSVVKAKEVISNDFILLESDLIFEEKAVRQLLSTKERDCILITEESGSGDETFVELRDNCLFKMGKDIHQFNRIDGEVVGITRISYELFKLMLSEFSHNSNPYINYEHTLLDVSRNYNVGYIRIDDLLWGEIDTKEQYDIAKKVVVPNILKNENKKKL